MSRTFKKKEFTQAFLEKQKNFVDFLQGRVAMTPLEEELYKQFKEGVENHFKDPNVPKKFHLQHVYDLNIDWDILFLYSKKDVGKTWQIVDYINTRRLEYPDLQIVYIRNTKEEVKALNQQFDEERWPIYMRSDYLFWKNPKNPNRRALSDKKAGFVAYPSGKSGFKKFQGSSHQHVKVVVWDECNAISGGLSLEVINDFQVFLSSVIRDKKDVKTFMFGNHLKANNIFLNSLNLDHKTNLKLIRSKDGLSTLLYLNTGDMYEGIEKQKGLPTMFSGSRTEYLLSNKPENIGHKNIYPERNFILDLDAVTCFVFTTRKFANQVRKYCDKIIYVARDRQDKSKYALWMDDFEESKLKPGYIPISCDELILNEYEYVRRATEEQIGSIIRTIGRGLQAGRFWFGENNTFENLKIVWENLRAIGKRTDPEKDDRDKGA